LRDRWLFPQRRVSKGDALLVHTLVCEKHLWFAAPCLRSLLTFCQEPIRLVIHDDGSLTPASVELLATSFPDAILVSRRSADAQMADALAQFPHMAQARIHLPHVIKLWDVALIDSEPTLCYVDADVLFQRRFRGLFPVSNPLVSGAFMMDSSNCFGAHPGDFWPFGPLRLARRLNSGLFWIRRDQLDYERMEYLFKRWGPQRIRRYHGWFEQTAWADQAWRSRCSMFDPTQLGTATSVGSLNSRLVGVHYVTPARAMLKAALELVSSPAGVAPEDIEEIRLLPSKPFGLMGAAGVAALSLFARHPAG
jgi:hypothetical protein